MKKLVVFLVCMNAFLLADRGWQKATAGPTPAGNGDVNADGGFNIADPVYLLNWLFSSGPEPVAIPSNGGGILSLPDTGQTECFDETGVIDCASAADVGCPGQDGLSQRGCPSEGRFVLNDSGTPDDTSDDTVADTCTGLMWQQNTADVNGDGLHVDQVRWCDALEYCDNLSFAGHDDWRLPNVRELQSILDYGICCELPPIDPVFRALQSSSYSSSTSLVSHPDRVWLVNFNQGLVHTAIKLGTSSVRAVRTVTD